MGRPLSKDETVVLKTLSAKIKTIVDAADQPALTATGVLDGYVAQDHAGFHQRFTLLHDRLEDLIGRQKIVVNGDLPPSMGANAAVGKEDDGTLVDGVDIRPDLVDKNSPRTVTDRAIMLLHEVAHNLYEDPVFPVRDYAYRGAWGLEYLPPQAGLFNADTYAEAAARIAERLEGAATGHYRATGRLVASRRALKALHTPALAVGPALAWVDIKVNRAWIRSEDYRAFARIETGSRGWDKTLALWKAANPDQLRLLELETALQGREKLIGDRHTGWTGIWYGLDKEHFDTADRMSAYLATLKETVGKVRPLLADAGQTVGYDAQTRRLTIPYALAGVPALKLADMILDVLVEASPYAAGGSPLLDKYRHALVDLFYDHDRLFETPTVAAIRNQINALAATAPTAAEWAQARDVLDLAVLGGITENWLSIDYGITHIPPAAKPFLETLDDTLRPEVDTAVEIGGRHQGDHTRGVFGPAFTALLDALTRISGNVTTDFSARGKNFQKYATELQPFLKV
ncbi:hypothetical protein [Actinomadura sp. DC4]|uniref:hypothetical protein n=1 Tax=Actinomadura sp. DC4 TaxID=3055069 RepID=UPI0025B0DE70|nr:hypothetical protein [Actinomadura sp. DC4]MDN3354844.1 hypothetical protein [Actinomadura sp. DC4]